MSPWPLFNELPALRPLLTPVALAKLPTPVQPLPTVSPQAWIKRDDLSHPVYGGNKLRKLEFVLGEIQRRQARRVITFGATGTNAGVATAMVCQQAGLDCTVLAFDQPPSPTVTKNQALMHHFGATLQPCGSLLNTVLRWYLHPARLGQSTYFLHAGCSNPIATFAYVNAAFELREQIEQGLCPEPAWIVVPVGSSATLAGLSLGLALAGLRSRVIGVRVAPARLGPFAVCTPSVVQAQIDAAKRLIQRAVPARPLPATDFVWQDDYFGTAYGAETAAGTTAIARFADTGIALEQTYTAKAAAAFLDQLQHSVEPVLFWHTWSSAPLPAGISR